MLRNTVSEYVNKTLLSSRFIIPVVMLFVSMFLIFQSMVRGLGRMGYTLNVFEVLPCYMTHPLGGGMPVYYLLFVFLIGGYPDWDGSMNRILRLGKRKWLATQYLYVVFTAILYYLVWTVSLVVALFPRIEWGNEWSDFAQYVASDPMVDFFIWEEIGTNVSLNFSKNLLAIGSPLKIYLLMFLLNVLCSILLGMFAVTLNIYIRRRVGTLAVMIVALTRDIFEFVPDLLPSTSVYSTRIKKKSIRKKIKKLKNWMIRLQYYISPLYQSDVYVMICHDARPLWQRVLIGILYFLLLGTITGILGMRAVKQVDLSR